MNKSVGEQHNVVLACIRRAGRRSGWRSAEIIAGRAAAVDFVNGVVRVSATRRFKTLAPSGDYVPTVLREAFARRFGARRLFASPDFLSGGAAARMRRDLVDSSVSPTRSAAPARSIRIAS